MDDWEQDKKYVEELIDRSVDLNKLYSSLGYIPHAEKRSFKVVEELKSLLQLEIVDLPAFQKALVQSEREVKDILFPADRKLWEAVLKARNDSNKVVDILYQAKIEEWGGYMGYSFPVEMGRFTRWTVKDQNRFAKLLEDLARVLGVDRSGLELIRILGEGLIYPALPEEVSESVRNCIGEVQKNLRQEGEGLWKSLVALKKVIKSVMDLDHDFEASCKKKELDNLLYGLVEARRYGERDSYFKETVTKSVKKYLDTTWMHTPGLTSYMLTNLLDVDRARLTPEKPSFKSRLGFLFGVGILILVTMFFAIDFKWILWLGLGYWVYRYYLPYLPRLRKIKALKLIRNEVSSGVYDGEEIARRLRQVDNTGLYVHSVTYPLLRLHSAVRNETLQPEAGIY